MLVVDRAAARAPPRRGAPRARVRSARRCRPSTYGRIRIGAGVGRREAVVEVLPGRDRRLREPADAVHGVGDPDPMPVEVSGFSVRFLSLTRTSSPSRRRRTGPGTASLKAHSSASAGASGWSFMRFGAAVRTRKPSSSGAVWADTRAERDEGGSEPGNEGAARQAAVRDSHRRGCLLNRLAP